MLFADRPEDLARDALRAGTRLEGAQVEVALEFPEVRVTIRPGDDPGRRGAGDAVDRAVASLASGFARSIVSFHGLSVPEVLVSALARRDLTLAMAESCTGGLACHLVAGVPGASAVLLAGIVAYSNEAKLRLLGVRERTLARHGAVSGRVAREMLSGALAATGADCAVATTGIAGPSGGTRARPVGLVYIGVHAAGRSLVVRRLYRSRRRQEVRALAAHAALKLLADIVMKEGVT